MASKIVEELQTARIKEMRGQPDKQPEERSRNLLTVGRLLLLLLLLLSLCVIVFMQGIYNSMGYAVARLVEPEGCGFESR
jgi:ABC-type Na+ efflux pump permease subunit